MKIQLAWEAPVIRRVDAGESAIQQIRKPAAVRHTATSEMRPNTPIQQADPPHPDVVPEPHLPLNISSPLERALRQLEGGRR
ncbi:MAG: hypothetical protein U0872_16125 [Planctomycetaceae bacterium]